MSKNTPDPPKPPDPVKTAQAQTESNIATATTQQKLNLINQNTPLGSVTYSPGAGGDPQRWTSDVTLSPTGQESFDLQQNVSKALNKLALGGTSQVENSLGKPLETSGLPAVKSGLGLPAFSTDGLPNAPKSLDLSNLGNVAKLDYSGLPQLPGSLNVSGPNVPGSIDTSGLPKMATDLGLTGSLPDGLDFSSLGSLPQFDTAALGKATDAAYSLQTSKLDPQYQQDRITLENRLINSGLQKGTPLYDQEVSNWERSKAEAYQNARNTSIGQGLQYGTTLFGTQLAGRQQGGSELAQALAAKLGVRQQSQSEATTNAGLANTAHVTGFGEAQAQASQAERAHAQAFEEAKANAALATTSHGIAANEAQSQAAQELALRQQGGSEEQAQFAAQQSAFQQALATLLSTRGQQANEAQTESSLSMASRQQQLQEEAYLRNLPLNEVAALLGTGQIQMPNFNAPPATSLATTDTMGAVYNSANLAQKNYQSQVEANASKMGGIMDLVGGIGSAALGMPGANKLIFG